MIRIRVNIRRNLPSVLALTVIKITIQHTMGGGKHLRRFKDHLYDMLVTKISSRVDWVFIYYKDVHVPMIPWHLFCCNKDLTPKKKKRGDCPRSFPSFTDVSVNDYRLG
jgi:hypothetical protein